MRAGKPRDVTALHALARLNSGSNGKSGRADRAALCALLDAGADHERDRTSLAPPSGEGCFLEDGTAYFHA